MATKKFFESPYTLQHGSYHESDFRFAAGQKNFFAQSDKPPAPPVVIALFGLGRAGSIHLPSILNSRRIILKYVIDDRTERFADLKKYWQLGDEVTFLTSKESDKVFKDKAVKAVMVCTPTFTHKEIVLKALENNKDVFCEKPVAENIDESRKCYNAAKSKGRVLYTAFNRRFDPSYRSVKERVRTGEIGQIQILKATTRDSPLPPIEYLKTSGGIFFDCIVHDFDVITWVLGELPIRAQASASAIMPEIKAINDFDTVAYLLTFPSGTIAIGDNSRFAAYGHDQRLEVHGNRGMIRVDNERPMHSTQTYTGLDAVKLNPIYYSFPSRYMDAYKNELEHFIDVIQYGVPQDVTSWQTLAVTKVATAVEKSARTGLPVDIDWSGEDIPAVYS